MAKCTGRVEKSLLNICTGLFGQMFSFVLSFVIRTVFIKTLGELYLGLNGLYSNILSVLNLTELGLGTAIVIELYRTVEDNNTEKTNQYLLFYKKAYNWIGIVILALGLAITPFLQRFIKDKESIQLINYKLVFILYLINTTFSYFFFAYRQSVLQANQAEYKARILSYIFKVLEMILQVVFLLWFKNIYAYIIIPLVLGCISTLVKGILIGRWYPYIKEEPKNKLSKQEMKSTFRNIYSVAMYKFSGCIINSTDNIILSSFISIIITGLYSNYLILTSAVDTILYKIFTAFTASIGNLNIAEGYNIEKKYYIFKVISFMNFWLYGFCSACFIVLFHPFIKVWIGEKYILNNLTEAVIVLNFLIAGLQETVGTHRAAYGLFYKGRYRPIFSILMNLGTSIVFVKIFPAEFGIVAVLLGTILSNLTVSWWFDAYIVHKYAFECSPRNFYLLFWYRILYVGFLSYGLRWICGFINISPVWNVISGIVVCSIVFNGVFILCFHKSDEFKYLLGAGKRILKGFAERQTSIEIGGENV